MRRLLCSLVRMSGLAAYSFKVPPKYHLSPQHAASSVRPGASVVQGTEPYGIPIVDFPCNLSRGDPVATQSKTVKAVCNADLL